jgi:long-chain acyl-CoA synthetase
MLYLGAIDVPLSVKLNEPSELKFRIQHSGCRWIITSDRQLEKVRGVVGELPEVEKVIVFGDVKELKDNELLYDVLFNAAKESLFDDVMKIAESLSEDDIANISYTSGTTADPKGIMLSHRNYTANVEQAATLINVPEYYSSLLILPWDHSFAHTVGLYTLMKNGASMSVVELGKTLMETLKNIPKNIKESKPTFLLSVPALAKNFRNNIESGVKAKGPKVEKLFYKALDVAYRYNGIGWDKGKGSRMFLKPLVWLYDKILFSKIRENFGGRLEFFIGGGALLDIDLQKFFYAIGIPMYQGYGLSEASPIISSNAPQRHKMGSSGFLVKPLELKILDEDGNEMPAGSKGEIVVKGENVMKGYWKNEKATAETLKDGWLYTGDMGYMDSDGFLYVLGRFKSLLIGNDGEKYSPEGIEEALVEQSPYIEQVMLYNNQNNYTVGLMFPNYPALAAEVKKRGNDMKTNEGAALAASIIKEEIDKYFPGGPWADMFPHRWLPAAVGIIDEAFSEENKMINSTMKVVRGKVTEHYKNVIDMLYSSEGKDIKNEYNIKSILSNA